MPVLTGEASPRIAMSVIAPEQALAKAREVGARAYPDVDAFQIDLEDAGSEYRVSFVEPRSHGYAEPRHFAVWIDKTSGEARLFKGR